jgi:hypothetical protein
MDPCGEHRPYVGALADGEFGVVPAPTRQHVIGCRDCTGDLEAHRLPTAGLRAGLRESSALRLRRRPRMRLSLIAAAAGVAATAMGTGLTGWSVTHRAGDLVDLALTAAHRAPQIRSTDPVVVALWCSRFSDRRLPTMSIGTLGLDGARMDAADGGRVVTIFYRTSDSRHITVGWVVDSGPSPERGAVEARPVGDRIVLVVAVPAGKAVLSGDLPASQLWSVAGALEGTIG